MAVIRETEKFRIGPIGVARASEGGQIVGQAISSAANDIAGMLYKTGAKKAEEAGLEAGTSAERAAIITINPKTGEPEAFTPPPGFGGIATDAYQRVIRSRFQQSIEEEIKLKSREFAVRFEQNPNAVGLYETAMADYIASMSNNATGEFSGYIKDVGTSYLNATRSNLAIAQIRRERAAAKKAHNDSLAEANSSLEAIIASMGPEAFGGDGVTQAEFISESANEAISNGAQAGLFSSGEVAAMNMDQRFAIARGAIRYVSQTVTDSDELRKIQHAIGTQDLGAIPEQYSFLVDSLSLIAQTPSNFARIEKFSDGVLSDRVQLAEVYEREAAAAAKQAEQLSVFDINELSNYTASIATINASDLNVPAIGVVGNASKQYTQLTLQARNALQGGNEDQSKAILESRDEVLGATVEGLAFRVLSGLTPKQVDQVENAVFNSNPQLAPESARESVSALLKLADATSPDILDQFLKEAGSYREGPARAAELEQKISAAAYAKENILPEIYRISIAKFDYIDKAVAYTISGVNGVKGLDEGIASRYRDEIYYRASLSAASSFYQTNPTEAQMDAAIGFIQTGDVGSLTKNQQKILTKARGYTDKSGKLSELRTYMNTRTSARVEELNEAKKAQAEATAIANMRSGITNPSNQGQRELASKDLSTRYASLLGELNMTLGQALLSGRPEVGPILQEVMDIGILPEELHTAFSGLASGGSMVNFSPVLLSYWRNIRNQSTLTGSEMLSSVAQSFEPEEIATLDALAEAGLIYSDSPESISNILTPLRLYDEDKSFKERVDSFFGDTSDAVYQFMQSVEGYTELPPSAGPGFVAAAIRHATLSSTTGNNVKNIRQLLQKQIQRTYPSGDGYVYGQGMRERTSASLSRIVPGNERAFIDRVQELVLEDGITESGERIANSYFAKTNILAMAQGNETLFLQPIGPATRETFDPDSPGGAQYRVMRFNAKEPFGYEVVYTERFGTRVPFVVSTDDYGFQLSVKMKGELSNIESIEDAESRLRVLELIGKSQGLSAPMGIR